MLSGIFRRRVVVVAAALVAGSALGAGVPLLAVHSPHNSAAAATATITLNTSAFGNLTFAKIGGINYDEPDQQACSSGTCTYTPTAVPPAITLRDPYAANIATYQDMMSWEALMREGNPSAKMDAKLTLTNSAGTTIASYQLINAWASDVDVLAGTPGSAAFIVTLTGDDLIFTSG